MNELRLTLISRSGDGEILPPATKKNSGEILCPHEVRHVKFHSIQPSPQYRRWNAGCLRASIYDRSALAVTFPVSCRALIYRDRNVGDANGFYQAIADILQEMGVVKDDNLIRDWDGSRLLKDPDNPRVEITLTPIAGAQPDLGLGLSVEDTRRAAQERKAELKMRRKAKQLVNA